MFRKYSKTAILVTLMIVAGAALLLGGCSSKSKLEDSSTPSASVAVTASPNPITAGETSVIEATVTGVSDPSSQIVTFTVSPSTAGSFTPSEVTADANGVAATLFTANASGTPVITASVQGTTIANSVSLAVSSSGGSSGSGNVTISATRSLLLANGEDTSQIIITVRDALGQLAPDGTVIKITAGEKFVDVDGNGYWSDGIDTLKFDANSNGSWDALGLIPSTAQTAGGTGAVTVDYISGNDAMTVYIKVTVDDGGISGTAELTLQVTPNTLINSIYMSSDSMQLSVAQTGGIESALLRATGYDINTNPVPEGLLINFIITDGPGGGEQLGNVGYGPYPAYTNSQGVATANIHSGTISGTIRIRAYGDTALSEATQILVSAGPPAHIVVGHKDCNVDYWDNVAESNELTAVVSDVYLNPVNDSTVVYFTCDEGTVKSHENRTEKNEGIAVTNWFSGNNVATADGRVYYIAETAGGTVVDTGMFFNSHFPDTISVFGWQTTIPADGESYFYVWVSAVDLNVNPVIGGTPFNADARYLTVAGGTFEDGCYSASDRVKVTSKTLNMDRSAPGGNDDGLGAVDYVTYWHSAGAATTVVCSLLTGFGYSGNSTINAGGTASPNEVVRISVTIKDRWGNPLADHTLNMFASGGTLTGATQETDAYGEATGFVWTAPGAIGEFTITVTDADPRGASILLTTKIKVE